MPIHARSTRFARVRALAIAGAVALAPAVHAATPAPVAGNFVGKLPESDAFVAIVSDGHEVRAYVCDGVSGKPLGVSEWFKGTTTSDDLELASQSGHARLRARLGPERAEGSVTLADGKRTSFTLPAVDGRPGFYLYKQTDGAGVEYRAGWIVLPSGEQRGSLLAGPTRRVPSSELNVAAGEVSLPDLGVVHPAQLNRGNAALGFMGGCFPCQPLPK